jgi:hypothetical protein
VRPAYGLRAQGAEEDHRPARGRAEEAAPDGAEAGPGSSRVSFFLSTFLIPFLSLFLILLFA